MTRGYRDGLGMPERPLPLPRRVNRGVQGEGTTEPNRAGSLAAGTGEAER